MVLCFLPPLSLLLDHPLQYGPILGLRRRVAHGQIHAAVFTAGPCFLFLPVDDQYVSVPPEPLDLQLLPPRLDFIDVFGDRSLHHVPPTNDQDRETETAHGVLSPFWEQIAPSLGKVSDTEDTGRRGGRRRMRRHFGGN